MAGYFNDGNGVKNITDGYFYDGDVKYYKDVVTTKYWKEITTGSKELEYACYKNIYGIYVYAKTPLGSDNQVYTLEVIGSVANSSSELIYMGTIFNSITEETAILDGYDCVRQYEYDLYIDTTVTETVEGTPEDYTYTTTETTIVEVTADDEYDYKEYYPKKIKQIYKVINGEAKLIFNNE